MHLTTREDIKLPLDSAFRHVVDLDYLERQLLRSGIQVIRQEGVDGPGLGSVWTARFDTSGAAREATMEIVEWQPPSAVRVRAVSGGLTADVVLTLSPLSTQSTRLVASMDVTATGLRDRMLLKGLQVGKGRIEKKLASLVSLLAREAELRAVGA